MLYRFIIVIKYSVFVFWKNNIIFLLQIQKFIFIMGPNNYLGMKLVVHKKHRDLLKLILIKINFFKKKRYN